MPVESLPEEKRLLMIAAARYRSEGALQAEIAYRMKISQPEISRLLNSAVEYGILKNDPSVVREKIPTPDWDRVEEQYFQKRSNSLQKLRDLASKQVSFDYRMYSGSYEAFTLAAAGRVLELLTTSHTIGIMWGKSVSAIIEGISHHLNRKPSRKRGKINCIPLTGDPVHHINGARVDFSASHLASELDELLNGKKSSETPCLTGVPAYVPLSLRKVKEFRDYLTEIPGYKEIFLGTGPGLHPLIQQVDTIISGIGIIGKKNKQDTSAFILERKFEQRANDFALSDLIHGDIGGLLVAKPNLSFAQQQVVNELNEGWTGITFSNLENIARRGGRLGPGIIIVAHGTERTNVVLEVIKRGLVNELIVDSTLAQALAKRMRDM